MRFVPSFLRPRFALTVASAAVAVILPPILLADSPFVDVVQFGKAPPRHPKATEIREDNPGFGIKLRQSDREYTLGGFEPIIDRALNRKEGRLVIHRAADGKWIPATVSFAEHDRSFATPGFQFMGRIVASKPSNFTVSVSARGIVTGTETGTTDDLHGAGLGYAPDGTINWSATETLDLNTGADTWQFSSTMKAVQHGGRPKYLPGVNCSGTLVANDSSQREVKIVASFDESQSGTDFSAMAASGGERTLIVGDLTFNDAAGANLLRYNDRATLTIPLTNHTGLDLNDLVRTVTIAETATGIIEPGRLSGPIRIAHDGQLDLPLPIVTDFSVPAGGLHFTVTLTLHKTVLARKTITVPTESFYRNAEVRLPDAAAPRLRAVAKYFGLDHVPSGDPAPELERAAGHGDELAAMWSAVFLSQGIAGYHSDQAKAYQLTKGALHRIEEGARDGDAEALYLLFYACQLGAAGDEAQAAAGQFLERSASSGFLPARFDRARELSLRKKYPEALTELKEVCDAGVIKAASILGRMSERGMGMDRDADAALKWYQRGVEFGDPDAILNLANLTAAGFGDTPPDAAKAMELARRAADLRFPPAMIYLAEAYLSGRRGVEQDVASAVKWFKTAADLGDRQAMLALGETYLGNAPGLTPDERAGLFWIRKAAERESPKAMLIYSKFYADGTLVDKDPIAARYWFNQAAVHGYVRGDNRAVEATQQAFLDFWRSADFSPSYVYVNEYGSAVGDSGDGMLNGLFSGLFGAMAGYYGNQQQMIDGLELIMKRNGKKIYGGTVSSHFVTSLQLKPGETVAIRSYGVISTGMMSGLADADGLGPNWPEYRIIPYIPCSAVMGQVAGAPWQLIGKRARLTAERNGPLALALNAIDYRNYKGYFDLVVEVPDEE